MRIVVSGSSGLLGSALLVALRADGHDVVRLVRQAAVAPDEVSWDPQAGRLDASSLRGVAAVINLAGAGVGDKRWSPAYRQQIRDSRVLSTALLSSALATLSPPPTVLLSGSAVGWYGSRGDIPLDETSAPGSGFLAHVCQEWEAATAPAEAAGIRVAHLRTGYVLTPAGGFLGKQLLPARVGLGGKLGSGRQVQSWIALDDWIGAVRFLLTADDVCGPVNLTAPEPATQAEFAQALGRVLHRPSFARVPAFALRVALGGFAVEVLEGARVLPAVLQRAGFAFAHPHLDEALASTLRRG